MSEREIYSIEVPKDQRGMLDDAALAMLKGAARQ
jgi:hypothetical protein